MTTIGLVGRIGAGKSTVARLLGDRGAVVVDADRIAHEMLERPEVVQAIAEGYGAGVLAADGSVDRRRLAAKVFGPTDAHAAALAALEAIIHPLVNERIEEVLGAIRSAEKADGLPRLVVLDIPLLETAGWAGRCDHVLRVVCDEAIRRERLASRGWSEDELESRDKAWEHRRLFPEETPQSADQFRPAVDTSGTLAYTRLQVDRFLDRIAWTHGGSSDIGN